MPRNDNSANIDSTRNYSVDDNGTSFNLANKSDADMNRVNLADPENDNYMKAILHSANLFTRNEFRSNLYSGTFRFGNNAAIHDSVNSNCREYLFFTKPNLNIMAQTDSGIATSSLHDSLSGIAFWRDLYKTRMDIIKNLEDSCNTTDPFNHLLQNMVMSNLDIPSLSSDSIETPANMFGVNYSYRGSSEASDDNPEFSLEFRDTKYLDIYYYFKAYEEYETLKHHGVIGPAKTYPINKIIHDQFSIYKFIVDEDGETILYFGKMYGVMPTSLPRDVFSNPNFDSGLSYSVGFKAAFYEDMRPDIIGDFNALSASYFNSLPYYINPYNDVTDKPDTRIAKAAFVYKDTDTSNASVVRSPTKYVYKLKWKGDMAI